jgi:hypothetical protein
LLDEALVRLLRIRHVITARQPAMSPNTSNRLTAVSDYNGH